MDTLLKKIFKGIEIPEADLAEFGFNEHCYQAYYALAMLLQPKYILEIGTYRGYALIALAAGAKSIEYITSIDNEVMLKDSQDIAYLNLRKSGYKKPAILYKADSLGIEVQSTIEQTKFDFIHIDGKHTFDSAYADLHWSKQLLNIGGVILMHDYSNPEVKQATDKFLLETGLEGICLDSFYRKAVLISK